MTDPVATARVKVANMEAECARLQTEIARLRDFINLFEELSAGASHLIVDPRVHCKRRPKFDLRPEQTSELMERIIRKIGRPMMRGEIVDAIEGCGVKIPFEDKGRYIGTIAWRHKGLFINIEGRGYWLRDEPVPSQ